RYVCRSDPCLRNTAEPTPHSPPLPAPDPAGRRPAAVLPRAQEFATPQNILDRRNASSRPAFLPAASAAVPAPQTRRRASCPGPAAHSTSPPPPPLATREPCSATPQKIQPSALPPDSFPWAT